MEGRWNKKMGRRMRKEWKVKRKEKFGKEKVGKKEGGGKGEKSEGRNES